MHQIRMTRRDEHSVGMIADCRQTGAVWEVPCGCLIPQGIENVLVVGRCADAGPYAWQVFRLIPAAAMMGQVAGVAATLALGGDTSPSRLEVKHVQRVLEKDKGFLLHRTAAERA